MLHVHISVDHALPGLSRWRTRAVALLTQCELHAITHEHTCDALQHDACHVMMHGVAQQRAHELGVTMTCLAVMETQTEHVSREHVRHEAMLSHLQTCTPHVHRIDMTRIRNAQRHLHVTGQNKLKVCTWLMHCLYMYAMCAMCVCDVCVSYPNNMCSLAVASLPSCHPFHQHDIQCHTSTCTHIR